MTITAAMTPPRLKVTMARKLMAPNIKRLNSFCARVQGADYIGLEVDKNGQVKYSAIFENHPERNVGVLQYEKVGQRRLQQLLNEMDDNDPST